MKLAGVSASVGVQGALDQHLIPRFGEIHVGRITKEDILNFRSALGKLPGRKSKNGLSAQRINHVMGVLRSAADRFHFTSPYRRIKPLKLTKSDVEPFTPAEVQQILQTVRKDFQTYLLVRFATGMRSGEIVLQQGSVKLISVKRRDAGLSTRCIDVILPIGWHSALLAP